jgi:site-specific DNA recombinase
LQKERLRLANRTERLVTAYQEDLLSLDELRRRIPELRKQQQAVESELQSIEMAAVTQDKYLRLVESLADFRERFCARADTLDITERQKILRLLAKEVLVGKDSITIRHSIPISRSSPDSGTPPTPDPPKPKIAPSYLLRSGSTFAATVERLPALRLGSMV